MASLGHNTSAAAVAGTECHAITVAGTQTLLPSQAPYGQTFAPTATRAPTATPLTRRAGLCAETGQGFEGDGGSAPEEEYEVTDALTLALDVQLDNVDAFLRQHKEHGGASSTSRPALRWWLSTKRHWGQRRGTRNSERRVAGGGVYARVAVSLYVTILVKHGAHKCVV